MWCSLPIETCMRRRLRLNGARMISLMHIMDAVSHRALQQGAQWASVCLGIEGMHWGIGYATRYWVCIRVCTLRNPTPIGCRVSEGQHCGKCTLPLFLISAPGKKDQRVGGWDVLPRSCISTPILI